MPPTIGILGVVEKVLPHYPSVGMSKDLVDRKDDPRFLLLAPVVPPEGNADGVLKSPCDPRAVDVAKLGLEVEREVEGTGGELGEEIPKDIHNLFEGGSKYESPAWIREGLTPTEAGGSAKIVDCNSSVGPLAKDSCGVEGWDDFGMKCT